MSAPHDTAAHSTHPINTTTPADPPLKGDATAAHPPPQKPDPTLESNHHGPSQGGQSTPRPSPAAELARLRVEVAGVLELTCREVREVVVRGRLGGVIDVRLERLEQARAHGLGDREAEHVHDVDRGLGRLEVLVVGGDQVAQGLRRPLDVDAGGRLDLGLLVLEGICWFVRLLRTRVDDARQMTVVPPSTTSSMPLT